MQFALPVIGGLFAIALTGCTVKAEPYHALANSSWRFISIDGAPPVSDKAHLEFREDRLGANLGCNGMGGPWRVEDERLMAGPLTQTEMYCEGPVWDQEQAIVTLLSAAPQVMVQEGKLELRSSGHSARLEQVGPGSTPQRQGS